jgi:hypothetical protein
MYTELGTRSTVRWALKNWDCMLWQSENRTPFGVLYTPPPFPMDSDGLSPDPANSDGPSGQSVGLDQIPLPVWSKSGESLVKSP